MRLITLEDQVQGYVEIGILDPFDLTRNKVPLYYGKEVTGSNGQLVL